MGNLAGKGSLIVITDILCTEFDGRTLNGLQYMLQIDKGRAYSDFRLGNALDIAAYTRDQIGNSFLIAV
jgi:hypothetical protein